MNCPEVMGHHCLISEEEVAAAIKGLKIGKAAGPTGVLSEMMKTAGGFGSRWMTDLINNIFKEGCIPDDWRKSILVPVYKGKGDPLVCGSYRAIKLLEQPMKVLERVLEKRIRCQVSIGGTTDAIFIMRQVQEKHQGKKKKLYYAFVDLEKAFDRVPREVVRWALRKLGVDEWLIRTVMALYTEACTIVRIDAGLSESFEVKVGLHQGLVLSPLLFAAVMDVVSSDARSGLPSELLYVDDLVIMAPTMEQLSRWVADGRASLLGKGLKVKAGKSKVMVGSSGGKLIVNSGKWPCGVCGKGVQANSVQCTVCKEWIHKWCSGVRGDLSRVADGFRCSRCDGTVQEVDLAEDLMVDGETYECVKSFCYLGDTLDGDGGVDLAATARIRNGWMKFRELLPFLTSRALTLEMKGRVYACCVRSSMTYGSETLLVDVGLKFERAEMQMIRWMCGISLKDRRTNEEFRRLVGVEPITTH